MKNLKIHWSVWFGISFVIAGFVSFVITLGGNGPPSFIEELFGSSISWIIIGIALIIFSVLKKVISKN